MSFTRVTAAPGAAAAPAAFTRRTGYISQPNVNFRQSPSADSGAHSQLALGTQVTVTGETGNYYIVTYGDSRPQIRALCSILGIEVFEL